MLGLRLLGGVRIFRVTGTLHCEDHGEFYAECDVDPPIYGDQVFIFGQCPECGEECFGEVHICRW